MVKYMEIGEKLPFREIVARTGEGKTEDRQKGSILQGERK